MNLFVHKKKEKDDFILNLLVQRSLVTSMNIHTYLYLLPFDYCNLSIVSLCASNE